MDGGVEGAVRVESYVIVPSPIAHPAFPAALAPPPPLPAPRLLGEACESHTRAGEHELESIASRLATLFSTVNEFPVIR